MFIIGGEMRLSVWLHSFSTSGIERLPCDWLTTFGGYETFAHIQKQQQRKTT
jgi:hypothetical protein